MRENRLRVLVACGGHRTDPARAFRRAIVTIKLSAMVVDVVARIFSTRHGL